MSYRSEQILAQSQAFMNSEVFQQLARLYEKPDGNFRSTHFEQAKQALTAWQKTEKGLMNCRLSDSHDSNPGQRVHARHLEFSLTRIKADPQMPDDISPEQFYLYMTHDQLYRQTRPYPVVIQAKHSEERLARKGSRQMDFGVHDFFAFVAFTIPLSIVLKDEIGDRQFAPFGIPTSRGIYVGGAYAANDDYKPYAVKIGHMSNGKPFRQEFKGNYFQVPTRLQIRTFIGKFSPGTAITLRKTMLPWVTDPINIAALNVGIKLFKLPHPIVFEQPRETLSIGVLPKLVRREVLTQQEMHLWENKLEELRTLVRSPVWRAYSDNAYENFMRTHPRLG